MPLKFVGRKPVMFHGRVIEPGDIVEVDDDEATALALRPDFQKVQEEVNDHG
jgi:hypothetical protein